MVCCLALPRPRAGGRILRISLAGEGGRGGEGGGFSSTCSRRDTRPLLYHADEERQMLIDSSWPHVMLANSPPLIPRLQVGGSPSAALFFSGLDALV